MDDVLFYVIEQGADWNEQLDLCNDDGSVMDLEGCSAALVVTPTPDSQTVLLSLSTSAGSLILTAAAGQLNWVVPASQTASFSPSPGLLPPIFGADPMLRPFGFYTLRIKWPNGQVDRFLSGQIALRLGSNSTF